MIDEKILLEFIKTKKEEFEKEGFANYEKYTSDLKNMKSKEAIIATMDVYVLMNLTRILDELIELIESGKFSSIEVYTDLVERIENREFNEDFINELKKNNLKNLKRGENMSNLLFELQLINEYNILDN